MHRGCFVWTPTPPLAGRRMPRPGLAPGCVCLLLLAGSGEPPSWARCGAPHLSLWPTWLCALLGCSVGGVFFLFVRALVVPRFLWFSGPGCLGPWRCALRIFFLFPPASRLSVRSRFFFLLGHWPLLGAWCPPPLLLCLAGFCRCARCPPPFFFFFSACAPVVSRFLWFRAHGALGLGAVFCLLCGPPASRLSVRSLLFLFLAWPLVAPWWLLPPPSCRLVLRSFFFCFVRPRSLRLSRGSGPGCLGPRRCALFALLAYPFPALCAFLPLSCLPSGRWLLPGGCCPPPPLLCLAVFVASARCCVPCVVLCCVSRVAVLRCAAARCVARCCAVVCSVVWLRSVGAAARRAVPSGAPRRPGALCIAALCFAVFSNAVCVLSLRGGVCCFSLLCFVLCVSLGTVLCVPCPLRSVRCCASLCWCACVVLFVWCVLLLAPGAVVGCRVMCCFLWCAVVRCWVWCPVVVCWCRAVAPCCPLCFVGGVGLCLFPDVRCCVALCVVLFGSGCVCAVVGASCCGVSLFVVVSPWAFCGVVVPLWCVLVFCCAVRCPVVSCALCCVLRCCAALRCCAGGRCCAVVGAAGVCFFFCPLFLCSIPLLFFRAFENLLKTKN